MIDRNNIRIGTSVRASDGESLGEVIELYDSCFVVEKGLIFPKDYIIDYDGVERFDGSNIVVNYTLDEIKHGFAHSDSNSKSHLSSTSSASGISGIGTDTDRGLGMASTSGFSDPNLRDNSLNTRDDNTVGRSGVGMFSGGTDNTDRTLNTDKKLSTYNAENTINTTIDGKEEMRIPVREEELDIHKKVEESGRVRIRKEIITEFRQVNVPVQREEIVVEHVPVSDSRMNAGEVGMDLTENNIEVPLHEERIEVGKRSVVKEEVVLKKKKVEGASAQSAEVRKERVVVDRTDEKKSDNLNSDLNRSLDRDKAS